MHFEEEQKFVSDIKRFVSDSLPLSSLSDEELEVKVEEIVSDKLKNQYLNQVRCQKC